MKRPKCLTAWKVLVLSNSSFEEWRPDIVPEQFDNVAAAEEWIRMKLDEEPGDLYVVVSVESRFWAQIKVRKQTKRKKDV